MRQSPDILSKVSESMTVATNKAKVDVEVDSLWARKWSVFGGYPCNQFWGGAKANIKLEPYPSPF